MCLMQDLYDSEINFSVSCFWDGGFTVVVGDDMNGKDFEGYARTWGEVEDTLTREALRLYPRSKFARRNAAKFWSRTMIDGMSRCGKRGHYAVACSTVAQGFSVGTLIITEQY